MASGWWVGPSCEPGPSRALGKGAGGDLEPELSPLAPTLARTTLGSAGFAASGKGASPGAGSPWSAKGPTRYGTIKSGGNGFCGFVFVFHCNPVDPVTSQSRLSKDLGWEERGTSRPSVQSDWKR